MNIQSLSIVVPIKNRCINKCKFCVSRTHTNPYNDDITPIVKEWDNGSSFFNSFVEYKDYYNRLQFARDNGCNVVVLTGTGEPIQNKTFLDFFSEVNASLNSPFKCIEMQTTGILLNENNIIHLRNIGVTTISFSISNIFENDRNLELIGCSDKYKFNLYDVISLVKKYNFNLRLSLNLVNDYDNYSVEDVIDKCKTLGADQVTFRKLYKSNFNSKIDKWIDDNKSVRFYNELIEYIMKNGVFLGKLPFGSNIYNIDDISMVVDDDCMNEQYKDTYKYLILRENCKLYFKWETKASLLF